MTQTERGIIAIKVSTIASFTTLIIVIAGIIYTYGGDKASSKNIEIQVHNHEERIRKIELTQTEIASDVKWIRKQIETRQREQESGK